MAQPEAASTSALHDDGAFLAAVEAGRASLDAGRSVPHEAVRRWLLSWGADNELPAPVCP